MDPNATLITKAEEAGRSGQSWNDWTGSDETQDLINACEQPNVCACETAFTKGRREHRIAGGWRVYWTTAPSDYDGFGSETIEACGDYHGKGLRRVMIDPTYVLWQTGRYGSGLHPAWEEDPRAIDAKVKARVDADRAERAEREARHAAGLAWLTTATETELEDFDTFTAHGITSIEAKGERVRRAEAIAYKARATEWAQCIACVPEGAILIDNGTPDVRGTYGYIKGASAHVYYNVQIVKGWPDDADHASVIGEGGDNAGSLAYVAEWIKVGRVRVAGPNDIVPPRAVVQRIGHERWKDIRQVSINGRVVWVGRPTFDKAMVLDEKGHLVKSKKIVSSALGEASKS